MMVTMQGIREIQMSDAKLARSRSHLRFIDRLDHAAMRVLLAEDDRKLSRLLDRGLGEAGMRVRVVGTGDDALDAVRAEPFDVVILDVMLPGPNGFEVLERMRAASLWTPVLMLTARDAVEDRVRGLDGGADDYLAKPFSFEELAARLRALGRRGPVERPVILTAGDLRLDPATRKVSRGETEIELSTTERRLLEVFLRHPGQILDRDQLLAHAWDPGHSNRSNVVDVYVRYLREKVDRPFGVKSIETVRGTGYRLRADGA
jgi:two-component system OmpR family response regulator